jgi:hypothetical protein
MIRHTGKKKKEKEKEEKKVCDMVRRAKINFNILCLKEKKE